MDQQRTSSPDFTSWLHTINNDQWFWYIKRLSSNDTGATGGHQVGVYLPNEATFALFPSLNRTDIKNPDVYLDARVDSHSRPQREVRSTYYNGKHFGQGTRNEARITRWKIGDPDSPLQNHANTGALSLFAFKKQAISHDAYQVCVWVCRTPEEESCLEDIVGRIYPGECLFRNALEMAGGIPPLPETDPVKGFEVPEAWKTKFPSGAEIVEQTFDLDKKLSRLPPDERLIKRRALEFKLFKMIEDCHLLPKISSGFSSVDEFVKLANSVSNRRKSRGGKSFELHLEQIFREQGLNDFATQAKTEGNKKPDFLFPSEVAYHDPAFPVSKLRMLAVKTTCKDRWRQILNEANRIEKCHLVTLQEGVSENQFNEMQAEGVILVVPSSLIKKYPKSVRGKLVTLEAFIEETIKLYE